MTIATVTPPAAPEPVLRVRDVSEHLDCDDDVIYRLIHEGQLRAIRVGRLIRIPQSALTDFIAGA